MKAKVFGLCGRRKNDLSFLFLFLIIKKNKIKKKIIKNQNAFIIKDKVSVVNVIEENKEVSVVNVIEGNKEVSVVNVIEGNKEVSVVNIIEVKEKNRDYSVKGNKEVSVVNEIEGKKKNNIKVVSKEGLYTRLIHNRNSIPKELYYLSNLSFCII